MGGATEAEAVAAQDGGAPHPGQHDGRGVVGEDGGHGAVGGLSLHLRDFLCHGLAGAPPPGPLPGRRWCRARRMSSPWAPTRSSLRRARAAPNSANNSRRAAISVCHRLTFDQKIAQAFQPVPAQAEACGYQRFPSVAGPGLTPLPRCFCSHITSKSSPNLRPILTNLPASRKPFFRYRHYLTD